MRKSSRNHGDKEVAKDCSDDDSDNDNDDDNNDDDDNDDDDNNEPVDKTDHEKPKVFQSKTNLEIAIWLVGHPDILRLANEMNNKTDESLATLSASKITEVLNQRIIFITSKSKSFK
jgi:ABC-type Zn2+ transport system substrate-binding protein/surface adhesin